MAHKTKIKLTEYEISGGQTKVEGTAYEIAAGETKVKGTAYDVFFPRTVTVTIRGVVTTYGYSRDASLNVAGETYDITEPSDGTSDVVLSIETGEKIVIEPGASSGDMLAVYINGETVSEESLAGYTYTAPLGVSAISIYMYGRGNKFAATTAHVVITES